MTRTQVAITGLGLIAALVVGIVLARAFSRPSLGDRYERLWTQQFSDEEVPSGYEFRRLSSSVSAGEVREDLAGILYAYFEGPDDRDAVTYQVYASKTESRKVFADLRASDSDAEAGASGSTPSFCYRPEPFIACYALSSSVIVGGEVVPTSEDSFSAAVKRAQELLQLGLAHWARV